MKRFAYASFGVLALAIAFHLGARISTAQSGERSVGLAFRTEPTYIYALTESGIIWSTNMGPETQIPYAKGWRVVGEVPGVPAGISDSSIPPVLKTEPTIRPNPFNPSATIDYLIPRKGNVALAVYDVGGRLVRTLVEGTVESGKQSVTWDGRDDAGSILASGTYFYSLSLDGQVLDKGKAVILK